MEGEVALTLRNKVYFLEEGRYKVVVRWGPGFLMQTFLDASPGTVEASAETPARWHTPGGTPGTLAPMRDLGEAGDAWTSPLAWPVLFQALVGKNQSEERAQ